MVKALRLSFLSGVLLVAASFTPVWAADEFGARFSNQAPAALGVSESDALLATQDVDGISAEDLNAIAPAAGTPSGNDVAVETKDVPANTPANTVGSGPFSKEQSETQVPAKVPAE